MNTRVNLTKIPMVVLALFGSLHTASAYYDPGVQRWINRDPIREPGLEVVRHSSITKHRSSCIRSEMGKSPDLYEFVHNSTIFGIDFLGLDDCRDKCLAAKQKCEQEELEEMPDDPYEIFGFMLGMAATCWRDYDNCVKGCPPLPCPKSPPPSPPPQSRELVIPLGDGLYYNGYGPELFLD
jgi:hypothetical protein